MSKPFTVTFDTYHSIDGMGDVWVVSEQENGETINWRPFGNRDAAIQFFHDLKDETGYRPVRRVFFAGTFNMSIMMD